MSYHRTFFDDEFDPDAAALLRSGTNIHPAVARVYLLYAIPLSLIPPIMLFYSWYSYRDTVLTEISMNQALLCCAALFLAELVVVPIMGAVIQRIGAVAEVDLPYQQAFSLAVVAPTPLWLAPLFLFVPSMAVNGLVLAIALFSSGLLIYQGVPKICYVEDEGKSMLLAGSIIAAGLVAWVGMMVMAFVILGAVVA